MGRWQAAIDIGASQPMDRSLLALLCVLLPFFPLVHGAVPACDNPLLMYLPAITHFTVPASPDTFPDSNGQNYTSVFFFPFFLCAWTVLRLLPAFLRRHLSSLGVFRPRTRSCGLVLPVPVSVLSCLFLWSVLTRLLLSVCLFPSVPVLLGLALVDLCLYQLASFPPIASRTSFPAALSRSISKMPARPAHKARKGLKKPKASTGLAAAPRPTS